MAMPAARVAVRVAVQSSQRLLRDALAACLAIRQDVTVVGRVAEAADVLDLCELSNPDVVVLDAGRRLGETAGRVRGLVRRFPDLNIIVIYRDATEEDLAVACRAGVSSLVPESHGLATVLAQVRRRRARHAREGQRCPGRQGLTDRELEIVVLTGSGHIVPEIAALLGISRQRVENLKRRVYAKLEVSSGAHAVARAASLGMLGREAAAPSGRAGADGEAGVLSVVCGEPGPALGRVVAALLSGGQPFVLMRGHGPASDAHWARWHRGPIVAVLVDPEPGDWDLVADLGIPAILVHSKPFDSPELAGALATGASALVAADRIDDHFLVVLRMVSQGYLVVDSKPMRPLLGAARARWGERATGPVGLPELTPRESDILSSMAQGHSIRQTARALGIAPRPWRTCRPGCSASSACGTGRVPWRSPTRSACCPHPLQPKTRSARPRSHFPHSASVMAKAKP